MKVNGDKLFRQAIEDGGFSVVVATGEAPVKGYAVAIDKEHEVIVALDVDLPGRLIEVYADLFKDDLSQPGRMIGGWICKGRLYLDISEVIEDRDVAVAVAKEREQLAIYRLDDSTEIPVEDA